MIDWFYANRYTVGIIIGVIFGILARLNMLRTDYRQYPTYPHGKIIHISLGIIAAGLGAVAVPALLEKNYTAVTFLSLAAQQFRDVRNMERQSLTKIDELELVPRGASYIEGIAMVFEGRNYLVIFAAFVASFFSILFPWYWGIVAGILSIGVANYFKSGNSLSTIATIEPAPIRLDGPDLFVGPIYIMNIGLEDSRRLIQEHALGFLLKPKNKNCRVTLANLGQRQAILHDISTLFGVYRDEGEPSLLPMAKLDMNDGTLALLLLPQDKDEERALKALHRVPVLESAVRMPSEAGVNQRKEARS
ncbi:YIEGIA family protein [Paenibacillus hexagrammi]|uniref:YIEGIA family protein n=1 Tax=Paenibacillus hexagrammi TaxID=2908839 RepID=A0ABY3SQ75_9BACL|nr:YIEGIA family protein [Paenibacillus sp. YPD9-1]UJF36203.1 YIEGIA family protein [Paenibacillus sp. YPD9-1]